MARSAKTGTGKGSETRTSADDVIADAEVISETPPDARVAQDEAGTPEPEGVAPEPPGAVPDEPPAPAGAAPDSEAQDERPAAPEPERVEEPEPAREPVVDERPQATPVPPPPPPAVTVKKVGFVPLVLGGVVAAGLGFAAGWQGLLPSPGEDETAAAVAAQEARIDELAAVVAAIPPPVDTSPLAADIAALRDGLGPLVDRVAALEARVEAMERAPANDGTLSATAIAAWQQDIEELKAAVAAQAAQAGEIAELQAAMAAQEAEMARMVAEAAQRLDAAESTVQAIEEEATANATATLRRAVLASLQTAVDAGQPYGNLLAELADTGVEVPEGLTAGADGVATLAALTESFPDAARAALAAARAEGLADDGATGVLAFLRHQLDVRSVEPREGDDPDAILSRAEAALRDSRLTDALAEIATLPEAAQAPMGAWIAAAEGRVAALSALQALVETLPVPETSN